MIIQDVKVINPGHTIACADVELANGQIKKITKTSNKARRIVIPGFIDVHTHGLKGFDVMDGPTAVQAISKELANYGTTSFAPTLMTAPFPKLIKTLQEIHHLQVAGANMIGLHLEGPFIAKAKKGAHNPKWLLKPSQTKLNALIKASNNQLKKIVLAPEVTSLNLVRHLQKQSVIVAVGHSDARGVAVENFIKNGAVAATHLWNGMSGFENRNPGVAQVVLGAKNVYAELICDLVHVDKQTLKLTIDLKTPDRIIAVTDAIKLAKSDLKSGFSGGLAIVYKNNAYRVKATGSIAGGGTVMYDNFKNLLALGYSLNDVVKMTAFNQASEFKLNKGLIAQGKDADLLVLDQNLQINQVIIGGKLWK